jgi:cytochrome o ubiquinol oxidase subunit 1
VILSGLSTVLAFALIWYIWWLAAASAIALLVVAINHTFNYKRDYYIPAEEVMRSENRRAQALAAE